MARARVDMDGKQGDVLGDASLCNYEKRFMRAAREILCWLTVRFWKGSGLSN